MLRWGDIAVLLGFAAAAAAAWWWLLLTPLLCMAALGAAYLALRSGPRFLGKHLWRRGAFMSVAAVFALWAAVTWAEAALYDSLQPSRVTMVLLPDDECPATGACGEVPPEFYYDVRDILADVFDGTGVDVYPFGERSQAEYEQLISKLNDAPRARAVALIDSIFTQRDVFDAVLVLQVNYQAVSCGGTGSLDFQVDLNDWQRGRWPTRAFWEDQPPQNVAWRQFEATIALDDTGRSPLLRVATVSMAARMLLAAERAQQRLGGERSYARAVGRALDKFADLARQTALDDEVARMLEEARGPQAPLDVRLLALETVAEAYETLLVRGRQADCAAEFEALSSRLAPEAAPLLTTAETGEGENAEATEELQP
jgi:hypothetical protein